MRSKTVDHSRNQFCIFVSEHRQTAENSMSSRAALRPAQKSVQDGIEFTSVDRRFFGKEVRNRLVQRLGDELQALRAYAVPAPLIFLYLLEADAGRFRKCVLRKASVQAPSLDS